MFQAGRESVISKVGQHRSDLNELALLADERSGEGKGDGRFGDFGDGKRSESICQREGGANSGDARRRKSRSRDADHRREAFGYAATSPRGAPPQMGRGCGLKGDGKEQGQEQ